MGPDPADPAAQYQVEGEVRDLDREDGPDPGEGGGDPRPVTGVQDGGAGGRNGPPAVHDGGAARSAGAPLRPRGGEARPALGTGPLDPADPLDHGEPDPVPGAGVLELLLRLERIAVPDVGGDFQRAAGAVAEPPLGDPPRDFLQVRQSYRRSAGHERLLF